MANDHRPTTKDQQNKDRGPKTEGSTQKARNREEQEAEGNMQNGKGRGGRDRRSIFHKWVRAAGGNGLSEDR
jgi:hypothetical protein